MIVFARYLNVIDFLEIKGVLSITSDFMFFVKKYAKTSPKIIFTWHQIYHYTANL